MKLLLQQAQESTIGVGSAGFYRLDYSFICQVVFKQKYNFFSYLNG